MDSIPSSPFAVTRVVLAAQRHSRLSRASVFARGALLCVLWVLVVVAGTRDVQAAPPPLAGWSHSASLWIDTTATGVELPDTAIVEQFPLLVRLDRDTFPFAEARRDGADIRFTTPNGQSLAFHFDHWRADEGAAACWVLIPRIVGATRQEICLHWGNPQAESQSQAKSVFNSTNGHLSVWHLEPVVKDEVGTLETVDRGTENADGVIGLARRFTAGKGLFGGEKIAGYPTAASSHSTSAWFKADRPNSTLIGWGNEKAQGKVVMQYRSPPHIRMDCYFSGGNVASDAPSPLGEWTHVVHTYRQGRARLYINGQPAGENTKDGPPLRIESPARLWIGGWYHNYDYVGELDEVRVANVERSAEWIRLEYESQRTDSRLVGAPVQPGDKLAVTPAQLDVGEDESQVLVAQAGGALRTYWTRVVDGRSTIVSTNRLKYEYASPRTAEDRKERIRFHAVYPDAVRTVDIPIIVRNSLPEPIISQRLVAVQWNGRDPLEITPQIDNLNQLSAARVGKLHFRWSFEGVAVSKRVETHSLRLLRAQGSGLLTIRLELDNGGPPTTATIKVQVTEPPPSQEPWIARPLQPTEQPADGQFIPREGRGPVAQSPNGTLVYAGKLTERADQVFVRLFADDKLIATRSQPVGDDLTYSVSVSVPAALVKYRTEMGVKRGDQESIVHRASDLMCGDVYLICGQSNAVATDFGRENSLEASPWVRTFGATDGSPQGSRLAQWFSAEARSPGGKGEIGYWGLELGRNLVERHRIPVCLVNGAVGGTRVDQHQRNEEDPTDVKTIYGRLLWRVREARLTHGVRGVLWHQGENDQGADGPTGGYGYETYRQYFIDLAASWKEDYPNIERYYGFQIWPKSCAMGINGSDNRLREVQRNLPRWFSNLSVIPTLGVKPPGGCHFPAAGYAEFAKLLQPLIDRDVYGLAPSHGIDAPNLRRAFFASAKHDTITLEFDSSVVWNDRLADQFWLDGRPARVTSAAVSGSQLSLTFAAPTEAKRITYLDSARWNPDNLLLGANGLAAFTFCEVEIE